jgi:hypothetical protein
MDFLEESHAKVWGLRCEVVSDVIEFGIGRWKHVALRIVNELANTF